MDFGMNNKELWKGYYENVKCFNEKVYKINDGRELSKEMKTIITHGYARTEVW
jgi:hypothetical protein